MYMYKKVMTIDLFLWTCNSTYLHLSRKLIYEAYYEAYVKTAFWDDLYEIGLHSGTDRNSFIP